MTTSDGKIHVVFWGTAPFAVPLLRALCRDGRFEICGVITRPDEPAGRKQVPAPPPIKSEAMLLGLGILQPEKLKDPAWQKKYADLDADVAVVVAYGKLIPETILEIPRRKTLNVHPSLLPKYRGPSPIQAAIASGDPGTGITIMLLDAEMDHGPILAQETVRLTGREMMPELEARLADIGARILPEVVARYVAGGITPTDQDHSRTTFTKIITRDDGRIDWSKSAAEIERLHRAYQPWPGLWTEWKHGGKTMRIKLLEISVEPNVSDSPGKILSDLVVACGGGGIRVVQLQPEGKNKMSAGEFLRGHPDIIGSVLR